MDYAALGLGNNNYQHYNRVIDVVTTAIDNAGARMILPLAKADDAEGNTEAQFLQWKESLLVALKYRLQLEEREPVYLPGLRVDQDDSLDVIDLHMGAPVQKCVTSTSLAVSLPIRNTHELFRNSSRNCIHLDFDLTEVPGMSYKTGDHLAVWPANPDDEVERLLRLLGLTNSRSVPLSIKSLDSTIKVPVPTPTTPEVLFRQYLEICAAVSRDTIEALAQFAPSPSVKSFLDILTKDKAKHVAFSEKALPHTWASFGAFYTITGIAGVWSIGNDPVGFYHRNAERVAPTTLFHIEQQRHLSQSCKRYSPGRENCFAENAQ